MGTSPPPGFYVDPSDDAYERWWDGSVWTQVRRVRAARPPAPPLPAHSDESSQLRTGTTSLVPDAASTSSVGGPPSYRDDGRLIFVRVAAWAIDFAPLLLLSIAIVTPQGGDSASPQAPLLLLFWAMAAWNLAWRQSRTGQSVGKQILGLKLVRTTDYQSPPSFVRSGVRAILTLLTSSSFGLFFDAILTGSKSNEQGRRIADFLCGTAVVRVAKRPELTAD